MEGKGLLALRWGARAAATLAAAAVAALAFELASLHAGADYGALAIAWGAVLAAGLGAFLALRRHLAPGARTGILCALGGVLLAPAVFVLALRDPAYELARLRALRARRGPPPGRGRPIDPSRAEGRAVNALARRLDAALVWCSNRSGNADIWYRHRLTSESIQLTKSDRADAEPCFGREGEEIFFTRYRSPDRDPAGGASIWCVRPAGPDAGTEFEVASGFAPRASADGRWLVFSRFDAPGRGSVWRLDLTKLRRDRKIEKRLLPEARVPAEARPSRPAPSPDNLALAFGLRSRLRGSAVGWLDLTGGPLRTRDGARGPSWSPDGGRVAWTDTRRGAIWAAPRAGSGPAGAGGEAGRLCEAPPGMTVSGARWSNHPRFFAFAVQPVGLRRARELAVLDLEAKAAVRVTFNSNDDFEPALYVRGVTDAIGP